MSRTPDVDKTPGSPTGFATPDTGAISGKTRRASRADFSEDVVPLRKEDPSAPKKMFTLMSYLPNSIRAIQRSIIQHVEYTLGFTRYNFNNSGAYQAVAYSVRDRLLESWNDTQQYFTEQDPKRIYYLSLEFLMGRTLCNAIMNLDLQENYSQALLQLGYKLEDLFTEEKDAALGNGGLGRLAACYMDSIATLDYAGWGYGIRYQYGMFEQRIKDGAQAEFPDYWLTFGNPWEIERLDVQYPVRFFGYVTTVKEGGRLKFKWEGGETVQAVAFDTPIPGYDTWNTTNLRLWSSRAAREFDLSSFNQGDYFKAIDDKQKSENISSVLYPADHSHSGKELRLKQQYFFVSATLRDALRRFKKIKRPLSEIPNKIAIQLNDTHPTIGVLELQRILMDEEELGWDEAWGIVTKTFAYTNHTVLPEALEKWSIELLQSLLPRHVELLYEINRRWLEEVNRKYPGDGQRLSKLSLIEENSPKMVRMANLAIVGSHAINGVAAIHSEILKTTIFPEFYQFWPEKFFNVTNGITPRRWLAYCNRPLTKLISKWIESDEFLTNLDLLVGLRDHVDNPELHREWSQVKFEAKEKLAKYIYKTVGVEVSTKALFDIQVKRIHEYKRQFLNILYIIHRYNAIKDTRPDQRSGFVPRVCIIGGKAAPSYIQAKRVIRLINGVASVVNADASIGDLLKVVFLPNYNVSLAEVIVPANDISQHISTAGTEASGTSCMKFVLNGGIILGTLDGANIEIRDSVGADSMFVFGTLAADVEAARHAMRYRKPGLDKRLERVVGQIRSGQYGPSDYYGPLLDALYPPNDFYLLNADFPSYAEAQDRVDSAYKNQTEWIKMSIKNTAGSGPFNSDRAVAEYATKIWEIKPCPRPDPNLKK